jgi:16S rRNA (cytosine1402-N4)-methyltransferase
MNYAPQHEPVLLREVIELLRPATRNWIVDCTLGLGGHARALIGLAGKDAQLVGMDADEANVLLARQNLAAHEGRVRFFLANFSSVGEVLAEVGVAKVDAVLADLGFSSSQMDEPSRGLSILRDGPLDMRLDRRTPRMAFDIVNQVGEKELADLIYEFGEERYSRRIARAIVEARKAGAIETTGQLAAIVSSAVPAAARQSRRGVHPATRTFQALRIAVNDELANLESLLAQLPRILAPGGRAAIISFHSLEDRRVKHAFNALAGTDQATILTKKPITPSEEEMQRNPRSRSAKLRGIEMHG